ncbi:MAG TPA: type IV pilus assembly protein PilM [Candidatus Saccharimonadales bacterium]|jgi:type IV pilus assembly protein PilM|nr:type IV pilus assembly protein PilM [Candidatus Saccharimonadales bacterium]
MNLLFGAASEFFGLDIGTTAIRLVQLQGGGASKALLKYAYVPIDPAISMSDSKADQQKLAQTIAQLVSQSHVTTKNVAAGVPSNRVFTTVADVDRLSNSELAKAIPLQADALIPTPLAESTIDWSLLGDSPSDRSKQEILLTSVPNKFVESRLDILESIGLNVIAFEPDNLAMARALTVPDTPGAQLLLDVGHLATDLVIVMNGAPHLTRSIPTGVEAFLKSASQTLNIDAKQAEQFVYKFGLSREKLEGQVFAAISGTVDLLTSEVEKSIKFFQTRYTGVKVDRIIVTGGASVIPEFPLYIANKFGVNVEIGNAWRGVSFSQDRQNELLAISNQFSVAVGLAERNP